MVFPDAKYGQQYITVTPAYDILESILTTPTFNPLILEVKKGHTHLNKPVVFSCRFD